VHECITAVAKCMTWVFLNIYNSRNNKTGPKIHAQIFSSIFFRLTKHHILSGSLLAIVSRAIEEIIVFHKIAKHLSLKGRLWVIWVYYACICDLK